MANPDTACQRCRGHKLRCGKERPICARCSRLNKTCSYPEPANRRELAAQRKLRLARSRKESAQASAGEAAPAYLRNTPQSEHGPMQGPPDLSPEELTATGPRSSQTSHERVCSDDLVEADNLPPRAIGLALLEIYFDRIYNAELLFRKSALFQSYLSNAVAPYLLQAIFALATIFLEEPKVADPSQPADGSRRRSEIPSELSLLQRYAASGKSWAAAAAAQVLPQVVSPSIQVVQTLSCLGLYSFARDDALRPKIYCTLAYTCCSSFSGIAISGEHVPQSTETEEKRRVFWACWAMLCVAAIPEAHAKNSWHEVSGIPLPEAPGGPFEREFMDKHWNCHIRGTPRGGLAGAPCSIMGEMMKLMGIWATAQILLRESHSSPNASDLEHLSTMVHQLYISTRFPKMDTNAAEPNDSRLLGLHSLYHLCRMTLLCPQVSIFSGRPQPESSPKDDAPARAQVIITHAVAQSQLVRDYLSKSGDISTISPLTGFSSFVSASTLLNAAKSWVSRTQPADDASRNGLFEVLTIISETLSLLEVLQTYWATLRPMTQRLRQNVKSCPELSDSIQRSEETAGALTMSLTGANTPLHGEEAVQMTYVEDETQITTDYAEEGVTWNEPHIPTTLQEVNGTNEIGFNYEDILHLPFGDAWDIDFMTLTGIGLES